MGGTETTLSSNDLQFSFLCSSTYHCLVPFCVFALSARSVFNEIQSALLVKPCLGGTTRLACAPAWARPSNF